MVKIRTANVKTFIGMGIVFILVGVIMSFIIFPEYSKYLEKRKTYIETVGIVVDYDEMKREYDDEGNEKIEYLYAPIVEYEVDGVKYTTTYSEYSSNPQKLGSTMKLRYNENNPADVIFDNPSNYILFIILSILFIVFGVCLIIAGVVKLK